MKLFFVCRETANENHQPFRAKGIQFLEQQSILSLSLPRRAEFFLPIVVSRWAKKEILSVFSVPLW
jgi:hypothetical protein